MRWWDLRSVFFFKNFRCFSQSQGTMRDAHPGSRTVRSHGMTVATHTVRSHGITVARTHLNDWLILILLLAIVILLNAIHPFYRFVGGDLKYPLKSNTVPIWAVPVFAVLLPMVIFLLTYFWRRDVYDLHHAILVSFSGLDFLSLYLSGKIQAFDCRGHVAKLCLVLLPLLLASLVAISRVDDYWHHWQDVFAGGLIGLVVAALCYLQFFPPPYHDQGWATYAYFRALEESQVTAGAANGRSERNNNALTGISLSGVSSPTLEDVESGRR
ncbi:unnamed protein product [Withania somnifera]